MTARWLIPLTLLLACFACPVSASAQWLAEYCREIKRSHCWPQPFLTPDRQAAREPFAQMVSNGWQQQNMLAGYHFEASTGQLTEAGKLRIISILTEVPEHHRAIYVHRALTARETAARVNAVQQALRASDYLGTFPPVLESSRPDDGWPAERVDFINRRFQASTPDPKLPPSQSQTGSGTSK